MNTTVTTNEATRTLTKEERRFVGDLWSKQAQHELVSGYVTTTEPLTLKTWNGNHPVDQNTTEATVPAGTTLKIVMISRFDDFGLTDDLETEYGYKIRMPINSPKITAIRKSAF